MMKKTDNKMITPAQIKALQACFCKTGYDADDRHHYIYQITDGRTKSTTGLTFNEASDLLKKFNIGNDNASTKIIMATKRTLAAIYKLSLHISFLNAAYDTRDEATYRMNLAKINKFCTEKSRYRKPLTRMNKGEIDEIKRQFEAIARKESKVESDE